MKRLRTLSARQRADLGILLVLAACSLAYLYDAWRASSHIYNLILVLPLSVLVATLCLLEFIKQLRSRQPPPALEPLADVMPVMGLFAGYVLSLEWLGFDLGTALFVAAFLWLHGERRLPWVIGYAIAFALPVAWFFALMLPWPMPMSLLPTAY